MSFKHKEIELIVEAWGSLDEQYKNDNSHFVMIECAAGPIIVIANHELPTIMYMTHLMAWEKIKVVNQN